MDEQKDQLLKMKSYRELLAEISSAIDPNHPSVKKALDHISMHSDASSAKKSLTKGSPKDNTVHSFYPHEADALIKHFVKTGGKFKS